MKIIINPDPIMQLVGSAPPLNLILIIILSLSLQLVDSVPPLNLILF